MSNVNSFLFKIIFVNLAHSLYELYFQTAIQSVNIKQKIFVHIVHYFNIIS